MLSRRRFGLLALGASALAARRPIPVALQLFSIRKQCEADLPGTLFQVAQLGFEGVELAGYYGRNALQMRQLIADNKLICCGAHVPYDALTGTKLDATIRFHHELGNTSLVVPGLPKDITSSENGWERVADSFTHISNRLRSEGLRLGYHNHAMEFKGPAGRRPYDVLFSGTPPEVFVELDLGNAGYGAANPIEALKEYPGRIRMVHVKDYTPTKPDLIVGDGQMDWPHLIEACSETGGTQWYVIEHDSDPALKLADISECLTRFRQIQTQYR